jgi:hypothetical protein
MSEPSREEFRARIKKTIERVAPEIDQTKVLSDEEMAALRKQFEERELAKGEARTQSRADMRARMKNAVKQCEQRAPPTTVFDPEQFKKKLGD